MNERYFCCPCCSQQQPQRGSTLEHHLGLRRRICKDCGAKRMRSLSLSSRRYAARRKAAHQLMQGA